MIILTRAVLHNPILVGGTNLQMNLETSKRTNLKMLADDQAEILYVYYNNEYVYMPYSNVQMMVPADPQEFESLFNSVFSVAGKRAAAAGKAESKSKASPKLDDTAAAIPGMKRAIVSQASTPHDHVFGGRGAGKTND